MRRKDRSKIKVMTRAILLVGGVSFKLVFVCDDTDLDNAFETFQLFYVSYFLLSGQTFVKLFTQCHIHPTPFRLLKNITH